MRTRTSFWIYLGPLGQAFVITGRCLILDFILADQAILIREFLMRDILRPHLFVTVCEFFILSVFQAIRSLFCICRQFLLIDFCFSNLFSTLHEFSRLLVLDFFFFITPAHLCIIFTSLIHLPILKRKLNKLVILKNSKLDKIKKILIELFHKPLVPRRLPQFFFEWGIYLYWSIWRIDWSIWRIKI